MTEPKITITNFGARSILTLGESITYLNCDEYETRMQSVIGGNQSTIILDCKGVSFLDSMALEMLLRMQESIRGRGHQMRIVGLNAVCQDILVATRLINHFHTYKDMQEAIRETS